MPLSPGSWKAVGMDNSPPRPPPTEKAALEMIVGRRQSMIATYKAKRIELICDAMTFEYKPRHFRSMPPVDRAKFENWVNDFMLDEPTIREMREGAAELRRQAARKAQPHV